MGPSFLPHAGPVFDRCYNLIHRALIQYQAFMQNSDALDEPDRSFLVVALDLLSGLTQGLGMSLEPYITRTQPSIMDCLTWCLRYPHAPVRQSAYALVGDLAMGCFPLLRPHMNGIMQELIQQLDPEPKMEFISACNNAAWSVGEVALRYGRGELPFELTLFTDSKPCGNR
jgi:transportin-1